MKFAGFFAVFVGALMLAQWLFFLASGQVPEVQSEPWRIAMRLAAEYLTAGGLILSGISILRGSSWGAKLFLFFAGMLCYSIIASPGYFAQQGQWGPVLMFLALLAMLVASLLAVSRRVHA